MEPFFAAIIVLIAVAALIIAVLALVRGPIPGAVGQTGTAGGAGVAGAAGSDALGSDVFTTTFMNTGEFNAGNDGGIPLPHILYLDSTHFEDGGGDGTITVLQDGVYQVLLTARGRYTPNITPGTWGLSLKVFSDIHLLSFLGGYGQDVSQTGIDTLSGQWTGELAAGDTIYLICNTNGVGGELNNNVIFIPYLDEDIFNAATPSVQMTVNYLHGLSSVPLPEVPQVPEVLSHDIQEKPPSPPEPLPLQHVPVLDPPQVPESCA
jgi:hypothetical protein